MHTATNPFPNSTSPFPRDLRGGGPAAVGAGKFYEVKPEAAARLRQHWEQQATAAAEKKGATMSSKPKDAILRDLQARSQNGQTAVPPASRSKSKTAKLAIDPADTYPASAIKAAKIEAAKDGRRNLRNVLTDDVLAIWHQWNANGGKTMDWIAEHNGLLELNGSQVSKYLGKYREGLEAESGPAQPPTKARTISSPAPVEEPEPEPTAVAADDPGQNGIVDNVHDSTAPEETAVSEPDPLPKPEIEAMQTAVEPFTAEKPENLPTFFDREYRPQRPSPGDALATLAELVNSEQLRVRGSVKLNLEIEFGE